MLIDVDVIWVLSWGLCFLKSLTLERSFPFKKRGKLSHMFIGLFEILKRIGIVAFQGFTSMC